MVTFLLSLTLHGYIPAKSDTDTSIMSVLQNAELYQSLSISLYKEQVHLILHSGLYSNPVSLYAPLYPGVDGIVTQQVTWP